MDISDFNFTLPKELIAQEPLEDRSSSKLMVIKGKDIEHKTFKDIIDYLKPGDVLVMNETKVEPIKLRGRKPTGAKAEFLIFKKINPNTYQVQIKTNNVRIGGEFLFNQDLKAKVMERAGLNFIVRFNKEDIEPLIQEIGEMPLPPYIKKHTEKTRQQYQTVYAKHPGSIAAPTAGFHFTPELMRDIEQKGITITFITLHVGYGTFLPVKEKDITKHKMHSEWFEISEATAKAINSRRGRLIPVGTTSLRALESASDDKGLIKPASRDTDIFIYPPYDFKCRPDALITNFHLPRSTLIMLVSALTSVKTIKDAYQEAIKKKYRFYSFGDSMLLFSRRE